MRSACALVIATIILAFAAGCSLPTRRDPSGAGGDLRVAFGQPNVQPSRRDVGVYSIDEPEGIRVKVRRFSLLSMIDEVAYRRGFNYRVVSDLTPYQVDVHGEISPPLPGEEALTTWERTLQREFANERELLDAMTQQVTQRYLAAKSLAVGYRWLSDGPEFFIARNGRGAEPLCNERGDAPPRCDAAQITFKKFFIRNVFVDEAVKSVRSLFFKDGDQESNREPPTINKENLQSSAMAVYRPQNAIVMRSTDPSLLDKISQLLFALDANYQQVLVETLIFQYDESVARRVGAALDYKKEAVSADGTRTTVSQIVTQFGSIIGDSLPSFFLGLTDTEKRATLLTKLAVYDSDGFVRVLAEPRLVLQSGEVASVSLNTVKHVLTTGVNTAGTVTQIPTGIDLKIIPTVLGNGKIRLAVELGQSEFVSSSETGVVLSTVANKVTTSIIAQDGEMVSIGGIHSRRDSRSGAGIPVIRDVPVAGVLFGSQGSDATRSRIEFMIRPTVERATQRLKTIQGNIEKANVILQREVDQGSAAEGAK
jgi:hypothetical protein